MTAPPGRLGRGVPVFVLPFRKQTVTGVVILYRSSINREEGIDPSYSTIIMKSGAIILLLVAVVDGSKSTERRFGVGSKVTTTPQKHQKHLPKILSVRGGGDLKDNLVTAATALNVGHGLLSLAAPDKVPELLYQGAFAITEGTAAQLWQEHIGSTLLGMALMTYAAAHTTMSQTNSVVYASGLCAYVFFRHLVKGTYEKLGFSTPYINISWLTFLTILGLWRGHPLGQLRHGNS